MFSCEFYNVLGVMSSMWKVLKQRVLHLCIFVEGMVASASLSRQALVLYLFFVFDCSLFVCLAFYVFYLGSCFILWSFLAHHILIQLLLRVLN